jgi:hypothetical protein
VKTRTALEAVGAALLLLPYYLPFMLASNLPLYHHGLPVTNLIGGLLVDLLGVALLAFCFLLAVQYLPPTIQRIFIALFAGVIVWRFVDDASRLLTNPDYAVSRWTNARAPACVVIVLLSGILAYFLPRLTQPAVNAVRLGVAAFAFSALWIVPQLLHLALIRQPGESASSNRLPTPPLSGSDRRIVWILFDELSYDQTFDQPAAGMKLPNFDQFRTKSVSFSNLKPAGYSTDMVIPSLFLGRRIDQIRATANGDLLYKDGSQSRWLAYDPSATLFGLAQRNGWNTGVVGWFNPYCHILASVLDVCSWEPLDYPLVQTEAFGASEEKTVLTNAAVLPNAFFGKLTSQTAVPTNAHVHIQEYRNVMARTQALIENDHVHFVFLHLPVPHPPGIYDRQRHMLRPGGTYLDNLVLADDSLGALLREIEVTASASRTTVIVSSDHSWRIPMWRPADGWRPEEERASGGRFDDRPVLLIHFPGQNSGSNVNSALPGLLEHDIIAGMLLGKINNSADLAAFLAQHGL